MANQWLRLWHDMPTDPKFGTVARVSGEHITLVLSVYLHLLTDASRNVTRGHVTVTAEDLATALNVTDEQIERVLTAMEGRLIESGYLSGWEKRQPKREDSGDEETGAKSAAQRKKEQREREKAAREANAIHGTDTQSHEASRNVTLDKDKEEDKEVTSLSPAKLPTCPAQSLIDLYHAELPELPSVRLMDEKRAKAIGQFWKWVLTSKRTDGTPRATNAAEALDWVRDYFARAKQNDFLMGRNEQTGKHSNWKADLDFLLTEKGKRHVIEKTLG